MRHKRRYENKIARPGLSHKFQMYAPAHPGFAGHHVNDALQVTVMVRASLGVGVNDHRARPQLLRTRPHLRDRRRPIHARGLGRVRIQLTSAHYPNAILAPVCFIHFF